MSNTWSDLRYAWRVLARNPGFTLVAVAILALGVGATSSILSVVSAVLVEDLPYRDAERLVRIQNLNTGSGEVAVWPSSYLDYLDYRENTADLLDDFTVNSFQQAYNVLTEGDSERVEGEIVSEPYFRLFGVEPILGRTFKPEEELGPGSPFAVIIGYDLWQRRFGGQDDVLGKNLILNEKAYEIIGVLPRGFHGITDAVEMWLPLMMAAELLGPSPFFEGRGVRWLEITARLKPGVTVTQVQTTLDSFGRELAQRYPDTNENIEVGVKTLADVFVGDLEIPLLTLLGSAVFVLLIAFTVVANLLLARAAARKHEIAVRASQGATRGRLIRQLLAESLLLAVASAALSLLLAHWLTRTLVAASGIEFQSYVAIGLDLRVVAVILLLAVLCALVFGLAPALMVTRENNFLALREGVSTHGRSGQRFQSALVIAEVALAFALLIGAALMIRGFNAERQRQLGFEHENLLTVRVDLKAERYGDEQAMTLLARRYLESLGSIPGVAKVGVSGPTIPTDQWDAISHVIEERMTDEDGGIVLGVFHMVSEGYFSTMGIPLIEGRDFSSADTLDSPAVVIIDEKMAREVWPNESALGKRLRFGRRNLDAPWRTIVGVVGSLDNEAMQELEWPGPDTYYPVLQFPPLISPRFNFVLRPNGIEPMALAQQVQAEMKEVAPDLPPYDVATMEDRVASYFATDRFLVFLMSSFAGLALFLALAGLYGLISYSVTQRQREIGLRMALGSEPADILKLFMRRALLLVGGGLLAGAVAAVFLGRIAERLLFGLGAFNWPIYLATAVALLAVALAAAWVPTRRSLKVEPTIILRAE